MQSEINEALARQLEASGQYKVLRRIMPATPSFRPEIGAKSVTAARGTKGPRTKDLGGA